MNNYDSQRVGSILRDRGVHKIEKYFDASPLKEKI